MSLTGLDISSYQAGIDLTQVPGDFVLIKATGGNGYVNPACDAQYNSARAAGKLVGLYHFAHEQGFQGDAVAEANFFIDNILGYLVGDVVLVLDFEGDNDRDVNWARAFLDQVLARTGVKAVIYLNTAELRQSDWSLVYSADYGLWVASYAVTSPTFGYTDYAGGAAVDDAPPAVNWGGNAPMMWQYADNARLTGFGGGVDADVLYGDADLWHAYARPAGAPVSAYVAPVAPAPAPAPSAPATGGQATIVSGDTLGGVAAQVGVSLGDLEAVNPGINYDAIEVGQVINLPVGANLGALSGAAPAAPAALSQCIVESGDTLAGIAAQFGTSVDHLVAVNGLPDANLIYVGQVLSY